MGSDLRSTIVSCIITVMVSIFSNFLTNTSNGSVGAPISRSNQGYLNMSMDTS